MTFYALGEGPSPGASTNVRVGTMGPLTGNPGNYTMTYTGADGTSPFADSKFFTITVAASGRVTTTASATGATSVFYLVGPNQGFLIGGTITASDSTRKVGGYFEPQTGGPYSSASASGDFVFVTIPPPGIGSTDITSGVVHLDGAGNATAVTDTKGPGPSPTLTTGAASTWTLSAERQWLTAIPSTIQYGRFPARDSGIAYEGVYRAPSFDNRLPERVSRESRCRTRRALESVRRFLPELR